MSSPARPTSKKASSTDCAPSFHAVLVEPSLIPQKFSAQLIDSLDRAGEFYIRVTGPNNPKMWAADVARVMRIPVNRIPGVRSGLMDYLACMKLMSNKPRVKDVRCSPAARRGCYVTVLLRSIKLNENIDHHKEGVINPGQSIADPSEGVVNHDADKISFQVKTHASEAGEAFAEIQAMVSKYQTASSKERQELFSGYIKRVVTIVAEAAMQDKALRLDTSVARHCITVIWPSFTRLCTLACGEASPEGVPVNFNFEQWLLAVNEKNDELTKVCLSALHSSVTGRDLVFLHLLHNDEQVFAETHIVRRLAVSVDQDQDTASDDSDVEDDDDEGPVFSSFLGAPGGVSVPSCSPPNARAAIAAVPVASIIPPDASVMKRSVKGRAAKKRAYTQRAKQLKKTFADQIRSNMSSMQQISDGLGVEPGEL